MFGKAIAGCQLTQQKLAETALDLNNNLASVPTHESTHEMHTLVVGQALTGENASR